MAPRMASSISRVALDMTTRNAGHVFVILASFNKIMAATVRIQVLQCSDVARPATARSGLPWGQSRLAQRDNHPLGAGAAIAVGSPSALAMGKATGPDGFRG